MHMYVLDYPNTDFFQACFGGSVIFSVLSSQIYHNQLLYIMNES